MLNVLDSFPVNLSFARWLMVKRKDLKLSQQDVAQSLGVSRQTVSNWETGNSKPELSLEQVKRLCCLLQVKFEEIPVEDAQS